MFFNRGKKQFLANWQRANNFDHHVRGGARLLFGLGIALVFLVAIYFVQGLWHKQQGKADVAKFYPVKCLGGWQYPAHAENIPELDSLASLDEFNNINSAVLDNAMAQLYCSNFNGESPSGTVPKNLTLKLSLAIKPKIIMEPVTDTGTSSTSTLEEMPSTSTTEILAPSTSSIEIVPVENKPAEEAPVVVPAVEEKAPVETPIEAPTAPADQTEPVSFLSTHKIFNFWTWLFSSQALAQEINMEVIQNSSSSTENLNLIGSSTKASGTVDNLATTTDVWQTMPNSSLPTVEVASSSEPVMPADALLQVSYTLDGQTWQTLGWVSDSNWRNAQFTLPLEGITDWSSLDWLQIRFDRVMSLNSNEPVFYLDGMYLEAEYDSMIIDPNGENDQPDLKKDQILKQKIGGNFIAVNVIRKQTKKQEIWYSVIPSATTTETFLAPGAWNKVEIPDEEGAYELLDVRDDIIFGVAKFPDRKMLYNYSIRNSNISSVGIIPNGLTTMTFEEKSATSTDMQAQLTNLYYQESNNSYYFSK